MMQVEVIDALAASRWPGAKAASTAAIAAFRSHCEALAQVQVRLRPPELFLTYLNCVSAELLWVQGCPHVALRHGPRGRRAEGRGAPLLVPARQAAAAAPEQADPARGPERDAGAAALALRPGQRGE